MSDFQLHHQGTILSLRAQPGSRRNELRAARQGILKACVTQSAEKGKANKAIIELLAKSLGLRKSQIELISGETSRQKRFLIRDVSIDELTGKINEIIKTP